MVLKPKIEKRPGVYMITNTVNGHRYIGSSADVRNRLYDHKWMLGRGTHHNVYLQRAYNKYGAENFAISVLLYCEREETTDREQEFLDSMKPEYNIATNATAPALGLEVTAETRTKLSKAGKATCGNPEYRKQMSTIAKQLWKDEEHRTKMVEKCQDKERKAKMSAIHKALWQDEEYWTRQSEARKDVWQERKSNPEAMAEYKAKVAAGRQRKKELQEA